jgi:hypothetical protein
MNLFACPVPLQVLALACDTDSHSVVVKRLGFREVTNVKLYSLFTHVRTLIGNTKVKPLVMASSICVNSHKQIILVFVCFNYHVEITRFKQGVEFQVEIVNRRIHACKLAWKVRLRHFDARCNRYIELVRTYIFATCGYFFIGKVFVHLERVRYSGS